MAGRIVRRRVLVAAVAGLALVAAGCGTTVPNASQKLAQGNQVSAGGLGQPASGATDGAAASATGAGGAGGTSATPGAGGSTGATGASGTGATASGGAAGSTAGRTNNTAAAGGGANPARGTAAAPTAPGVTDATINIGLLYTENGAAANAAIGAAGITQGDEKANDQIVIDDINAHGGVAGRKIVPIFHGLDATSTNTLDSQYQAACDDLTQDHKVFAAFAGSYEVFLQCAETRGITALTDNLTQSDAAIFQRFPHYYEIGSLNLDRVAAAEVAGLNAQGYFSGWDATANAPAAAGGKAKLGIVTFDDHRFAHAVDQVMIPALAKLGYAPDPADVARISPGGGRESDLGAAGAAISNAVLKFRSDGVEHVLIFEASGTLSLLFLNNAKSQHYYPRQGVNTQDGLQALADAGDVQKDQLVGAVGVGWDPSIDITPSQNTDDGPFSNDQRRACLALLKAHGQTYSDANAEAIALLTCDEFGFFRQVMNAIGPTVSRDAFQASVNRLGSSWPTTSVIPTFFGPNQHDGLAVVRYWAYKSECGCMQYVSGNVPA